jgi:glycine/D-amino acid oxidase-like deaminating enzyme
MGVVMNKTIIEPSKEIPVAAECDVLVVGGGPAGSAAAVSAARMGANTILLERYGHLGGMASGGFVLWIDRMTDWTGKQVIAGFANDLLDRIPKEGLLGPPDQLWGSSDPKLVEYWQDRMSAFNGMITWSPMVDPEMLKLASLDVVKEQGVNLRLHSWGVAAIQEGEEVRGVFVESKEGRHAILAKVVIDTTGDGDIFALAGADFESDTTSGIHHSMNVAFLWREVDMERYLAFRRTKSEEYDSIVARLRKLGSSDILPTVMPRNDHALFMGPRLYGYSSLSVEDLTAVEIESRRRMVELLEAYRENMPGFENAIVEETADQIGTRHSRRLVGVKKMTREAWLADTRPDDEVGVSPPPNPRNKNLSIPLGCLIPESIDNLHAAGRNLSCEASIHTFMREIPQCWAMGQAAGVAAATAANSGVLVRDVDVREVQKELKKQMVYLSN